jgi:hypothetical protein
MPLDPPVMSATLPLSFMPASPAEAQAPTFCRLVRRPAAM